MRILSFAVALMFVVGKWDAGKWQYDKISYTFHKHREFYGNISRITIKRDACGDYWLYMLTDFVESKPLPSFREMPAGEADVRRWTFGKTANCYEAEAHAFRRWVLSQSLFVE